MCRKLQQAKRANGTMTLCFSHRSSIPMNCPKRHKREAETEKKTPPPVRATFMYTEVYRCTSPLARGSRPRTCKKEPRGFAIGTRTLFPSSRSLGIPMASWRLWRKTSKSAGRRLDIDRYQEIRGTITISPLLHGVDVDRLGLACRKRSVRWRFGIPIDALSNNCPSLCKR
jgi:hypothetical protein